MWEGWCSEVDHVVEVWCHGLESVGWDGGARVCRYVSLDSRVIAGNIPIQTTFPPSRSA